MRLLLHHPEAGDTFFTLGAQPVVLGREKETVDIELDWDIKVSRRHARLWMEDGQVHFQDLGTTNGSWVGLQRLEEPIRLDAGTSVRLGETLLTLAPAGMDSGDFPSGGDDLAGATIQMTADARFEGLGELVGRAAGERVAVFLEALHGIAGRLLHSTDPRTLSTAMRTIFDVVRSAQRIYLALWPPSVDGKLICTVAEDSGSPGGAPSITISRGLARHAASRRQAFIFIHGDPTSPVTSNKTTILHGIGSAIYVPLMETGEKVVGMLCVDTSAPSPPFSSEDFQFVRAVADLVTAALTADKMRQEARRHEMEGHELKARRDSMVAFLKIASHDLKNPLTVVQIAAYTLKTPNGEKFREMLADQLTDAARRARALIDSYLEVCAVEGGHALRTHLVSLDPRELVDQEFAFLRSALAPSRQQSLTFDNRVDCGLVVADLEKCRQIFSNLLSNATKYSPAGGTITVSSQSTPEGTVFTVRDQGVGISEHDQQKLFEQFQRVGDPSVAPGTGLGLWMIRTLIEAHGGRIWVESEPGQGSAFHFLLPMVDATTERMPPSGQDEGPGTGPWQAEERPHGEIGT